ncbi:MAG TPA: magnesium-translocating P-type ATPase [Acidobacteriaceae bacterium]|nr:magnesium-translocating P-type ATPase [Acidobacteriaceae bacterium]
MATTANISFPGLSSQEATARIEEFGPNELPRKHGRQPWLDFLVLFTNPLAIILLIAAAISRLIGETFDATLIAALVLLGATIDFVQSYRSRKIIEHLRAKVAATASVQRDGTWQELPRRVLVPGDIIRLSAGDLIPADARLFEARDLFVQQAMLTGESAPTEKTASDTPASQLPNAPNMIFVGTSVVSGTAIAEVIATGSRTAFGDIAAQLSERAPETAFDIGLRRFGYLITRFVFGLVLFVLLISLALHRPAFDSLLFAVSLAVGLTPEFLPMITSVTLSRGALAMARKQVIVKRLPAIQNLGSIDILCCDKTGTLTSGALELHGTLGPDGKTSPRALAAAQINSQQETGIRSPLDTAILATPMSGLSMPRKLDEIPFDFQRRRLSVVVERDGKSILICKGSPEGILPLVTAIASGDRELPITAEQKNFLTDLYKRESANGFRVLAVAERQLDPRGIYTVADENNLTFLGYLSFSDPILPDAAETIQHLKEDGIEIKILSGDSDLVTKYICQDAGMPISGVVLGDDLENISEPALVHLVNEANIFARLSPAQKVRVLNALRHSGHVVGFIGDGINDSPAMHAADIGIAAPHAVDIAQDASDVVMLKPGLNVLHDGIVEGRRAFGNVMKYLLMGTSSNFGNVLSMAAASVVLPFLPMLPTQILLNNFLYDLSQLTIPTDNVDPEYIQKPQHWDIRTIRRFMVLVGPISSLFDFLTFYVMLRVFHAGEVEFHTGWFVESLATQTLVLLIIRTMRSPLRSRPSNGLLITVAVAVIAGLWLPYSRFAQRLGFVGLHARYFIFLGLATGAYLLFVEFAKRKLFPVRDLVPHLATPVLASPVH